MIRLKNGIEIPFNNNIDEFFQSLINAIIEESEKFTKSEITNKNVNNYKEILFKEIMDNSILVTHQIFEFSKVNEKISKFLVSGFLFNNIILMLSNNDINNSLKENNSKDTIH